MRKLLLLIFLLFASPVYAYSNSSIICDTSNTSLIETLTVTTVNTSNTSQIYNTSTFVLSTRCANGCDNITMSCNRPVYEQNLIILGLCVLIGVFIIWVFR